MYHKEEGLFENQNIFLVQRLMSKTNPVTCHLSTIPKRQKHDIKTRKNIAFFDRKC
jgi:hypothetical protein